MQFSNRRQTGGLNNHVDQLPRERSAAADHFPLITRHPSLACPDAAESRRRAIALIWLSPRRMLLWLRQPNEANIAESAQMNPARIE